MEWMSPTDAWFLHLEGPMNPMHIVGVSIFEGPAPPFERLEEIVDAKLGMVPRYRQKVRFVPLGMGRPVWVDDPHFNLSYHLRHTALPPPGSDDQLRRTAARIFAQHLDRAKPLWEIWMVEGVRKNRWAHLRLSDVKAVRASLGGTVNDVVLAVVAGGLRELLASRGEPVADRTIRALVPVSVRTPEEKGVYNNRVSAMFADLPVGMGDPV